MWARRFRLTCAKLLAAACLFTVQARSQQQISNRDRGRAQEMLRVVADVVRRFYYDPKFHGVDWDAKVAEINQKIEKANSFNMALSEIGALLDSLNDSHTFFLPPQHLNRYDYGWQYQMIGEQCFLIRVHPGSDAQAKGLTPGDEILAIDGYRPTRDNVWRMKYAYSVLRPQLGFRLLLQDPHGKRRQVDVAAAIHEEKKANSIGPDIGDAVRQLQNQHHLMRARYEELSDQVIAVQFPAFMFSASEVDSIIDKARKYPALIVDLRDNSGGSAETLKYLLGGVFDKEVKIADRVGRKATKPEVAKPQHHQYSGKLVVLVDSSSASAAELFARVVQIEKRGTVVGDRTSGSVMEAKHYHEQLVRDSVIYYGASVTEWDLIMTDGKSLEHTGVTPDTIVLPTAQELAAGSDPVLARAAEILGVKLSAEQAGKLFPYEWPPD